MVRDRVRVCYIGRMTMMTAYYLSPPAPRGRGGGRAS